MKVEYQPTFLKDLKRLRGSDAFERIKSFAFDEAPAAPDPHSLSGIKRLTGADGAYRVRIGDHRIGILLRGDAMISARVLHRREIYRYFP